MTPARARRLPRGRRARLSAVVEHALLLDGSTLNLAGSITGPLDESDAIVVRLRGGHDAVERPVDVDEIGGTEVPRWSFRTHASTRSLLAHHPERIEVELMSSRHGLVPLRVAPGFDDTPNAAVMEPIPVREDHGCRLRFEVGEGLALRVRPLAPVVEVARVSATDQELCLELVSSPTGSASVIGAWLRPRGTTGSAADVPLVLLADGRWCLDETGGAQMAPATPVWDLWARWEVQGEPLEQRVGRRRSDLLALQESVALPRLRFERADAAVRVTPYFTRSRHLAVRARTLLPSPEG